MGGGPLNAEEYVADGFGVMMHFTFWVFTQTRNGDEDPNDFNPTNLDVGQWLDAIAASGAKYAILTAKHITGFCLWPSEATAYNVSACPWYVDAAHSDIIKLFVDGCNSRGIKPCIYYNMDDLNYQLNHPGYTDAEYTTFVKAQLSELLTNYGDITAIWTDGWGYIFGYTSPLDYDDIYSHIKTLQPDCLLIENNHLHSINHTDIRTEEYPTKPAENDIEESNPYPAEFLDSVLIGNEAGVPSIWNYDEPVSYNSIATLRARRTIYNNRKATYTLNLAPDATGQLPAEQVAILAGMA